MAVTPCRPKWKSTLTDRERFTRQMHHQPADRCYNMEFGYWEENFSQWPIFLNNGVRSNSDANVFFQFDSMGWCGANIDINPPFEEKVVEETATTRIVMNGDGLTAEVPKDSHATIPHFLKATVTTPDDWKRCKEERFRRDDPARKVNAEQLKLQHPDDHAYPLCVHCGSLIGRVRDMLTFEGLAYACFDYPEMVEDMVETRCLLIEDMLDQVLPHVRVDLAGGWEDICFKNGPICSVDFFEQVVVPRYERISRKLRAAGVDLWFTDCDGDVRPLLPGFLKGGVNCMFPWEVNSSGHPGAMLDKYGPELRIMGGMDKIQLRAGREAVRAYIESLAPYVEKGGFIPFCDHRCPPDVDQDVYLYYLDLKEKMFGMR